MCDGVPLHGKESRLAPRHADHRGHDPHIRAFEPGAFYARREEKRTGWRFVKGGCGAGKVGFEGRNGMGEFKGLGIGVILLKLWDRRGFWCVSGKGIRLLS